MEKQQHPIDDLFRRELADYKVVPSQESRAAFMRDVGKEIRNRPSSLRWILLSGVGLLVVVGVIVGIYLNRQLDDRSTRGVKVKSVVRAEEKTGQANSAVKKLNEPVSQPLVQAPLAKANEITEKEENNENRRPDVQAIKNPARSAIALAPLTSLQNTTQTQNIKAQQTRKPNLPGTEDVKPAVTAEMKPTLVHPAGVMDTLPSNPIQQSNPEVFPPAVSKEQPVQKTSEKQQSEQKIQTENQEREKKRKYQEKSPVPKKWNINAGLYYTPEVMFNTLNGDKNVNNLGVEGTFHFGPYSVRTGVGLSITTGSNEVLVKTNPYLGTYKALDSIAFNWDNNYNLIPTYYSTNKEVFDTILNSTYTNYKKRYTYLQVPLILGYDFWQNRRLSLGVRGGAMMSVLLNKETLSEAYDPGKDKIIVINDITPDRIQLNWQAVAGINASFRLSRKFSIELEPNLRYYFNSVYEPSELTKKLWSVGLRAAILVTF